MRIERDKIKCSMSVFFCSLWFKQQSAVRFFLAPISFFALNELCYQMEFRIILKQFQNIERPKRRDESEKNNDTENGKMFCQQQKRIGTNENEETQTHIRKKIHNCCENGRQTTEKKLWWREWIERRETTAQTMSTFYCIAFLVAKLEM